MTSGEPADVATAKDGQHPPLQLSEGFPMTGMINLPNGAVLQVDEAPKALRMTRLFGGARIELTVAVSANQNTSPASRLIATLVAGHSNNQGQTELCEVVVENLVNASQRPVQYAFVGRTSDQALRELEEMRQDGPVWLTLRRMRAVSIAGDPLGLVESGGGDLSIHLLSQEWTTQLEKVTSASYVDILIPVTDDPELALAAGRVRSAREHIRAGQFEAAAGELRKALEPVRTHYRTLDVFSVAQSKAAKDRNKEERWAVRVQNTFNWITSFVHDDEESIKGCTMDRAEANDALATVAGLLHRLAADRAVAAI